MKCRVLLIFGVVLAFVAQVSPRADAADSGSPRVEGRILRVPQEWKQRGFPDNLDVGSEVTGKTWAPFMKGFMARAASKKLDGTDVEIFRFMLAPWDGRNGQLDLLFAGLAEKFAGSKLKTDLLATIRPLLDHKNEDVRVHAAYALSLFKDHESVPKMLPLLDSRDPGNAQLIRQALKRLGYEVPYTEPAPETQGSPAISPSAKSPEVTAPLVNRSHGFCL